MNLTRIEEKQEMENWMLHTVMSLYSLGEQG